MTFNRGFSLVEILIASAVVVLSGLGTLKLYSYIEVTRTNATFWIDAQMIANSQIAIMQRVNTQNESCNSSSIITFENVESCFIPLDGNSSFVLKTRLNKTLNYLSDVGVNEPFAKMLTVAVNWSDRNGELQALTREVTVTKTTNLLD